MAIRTSDPCQCEGEWLSTEPIAHEITGYAESVSGGDEES